MRAKPCALLLAATLLVACKPAVQAQATDTQVAQQRTFDQQATAGSEIGRNAAPSRDDAAKDGNSRQPNSELVETELGTKLKRDMSYSDFREQVLDAGWKPVINPQCLVDVVGGTHETACAAGNSALCAACSRLPELQSYGAGGYALVRFQHPTGVVIEATAFGEFKNEGDAEKYDPGLLITDWQFSEMP